MPAEPSTNNNNQCTHAATLPTTGDEPVINDAKWERFKSVNNCYAYMLDDNSSQYLSKPQPGSHYFDMKSKYHNVMMNHYDQLHAFVSDPTLKTLYIHEKKHHENAYNDANNQKVLPTANISCSTIQDRMKLDNNNLIFFNNNDGETSTCPAGYYKAFYAVDLKTNTSSDHADYHFYRQNSDKMWSHKPGGNAVSHVDADNCPIYNPRLSNRDYGDLNYATPCSFFCVPSNYTDKTNIS